jgi:hypothetical protein
MNIQKIAKDTYIIRALQNLWDAYKHNLDLFSKKVKDLLKRNSLSYSADKAWLSQELKKLTGEDWQLSRYEFTLAHKKQLKKKV